MSKMITLEIPQSEWEKFKEELIRTVAIGWPSKFCTPWVRTASGVLSAEKPFRFQSVSRPEHAGGGAYPGRSAVMQKLDGHPSP